MINYKSACAKALKRRSAAPRVPRFRFNPAAAVVLPLDKALFKPQGKGAFDPLSIGLRCYTTIAGPGGRRRLLPFEQCVKTLPASSLIRWDRKLGEFHVILPRPSCLSLLPPPAAPPLLTR